MALVIWTDRIQHETLHTDSDASIHLEFSATTFVGNSPMFAIAIAVYKLYNNHRAFGFGFWANADRFQEESNKPFK